MRTRNNGIVSQSSGGKSRGRARMFGMPAEPPAPPPSGTVTQAIIDFKDASLARPEGQHLMALDDNMRREMVLLTGTLAPRAAATHVAVQDGNWTDATTWLNVSTEEFQAPTAGAKILIPQGITVTYNSNATTVYDWIRHDGVLNFVTDANTQLFVDTIVSDHNSEWIQGTSVAPIPVAYTSTVTFPDGGDLDPSVDTLLIGRGWVSMGDVTIHGASKLHRATSHQTRAIGDTTITLNETPTGWQVGDQITIGGTTFRGWSGGWDGTRSPSYQELWDDDVTITAIDGNTITFTPALQHERNVETPRADPKFSDVVYFIGNYTRNVTFQSPPGTAIHRRGHIMWMHSQVDARYAASNLVGRTRKDVPSWDATDDARRIIIQGSDIPWAADANVRGRYNWHLHRAGVGGDQPYAELVGLAASDAPGWIYAHHSSRANITNCVGRRTLGVGFMAEVGDEIGTWSGLLVQHSVSLNGPTVSGGSNSPGSEKDFSDGDFGRRGNAYWWRSRVIEVLDCWASDCDTWGVWMSRGSSISPPLADLPFARVFLGGTFSGLQPADEPVLVVKGARSMGCRLGIMVIKANPNQEHAHRSLFFDMMFVHGLNGMDLQYTSKYSFLNTRIFRWDNRNGIAVSLGQGSIDMVFQDLVIRNSNIGVNNSTSTVTRPAGWDHTFIDFDCPEPKFNNTTQIIQLDTSAIVDRPLTWTPSGEPWFPKEIVFGTKLTRFEGPASDRVVVNKDRNFYGITATLKENGLRNILARDGYWTHAGARYCLVPDMLTDKIINSDGTYNTRNLTVVVRVTGQDSWMTTAEVVNNGALPQRYVDAITAQTWVVYEDRPEGVPEGI